MNKTIRLTAIAQRTLNRQVMEAAVMPAVLDFAGRNRAPSADATRRVPRPRPREFEPWRFRVLGAIIPDLDDFVERLHRPRHCRLLPSVDPQQLGQPTNCRVAGTGGRDSAAPAGSYRSRSARCGRPKFISLVCARSLPTPTNSVLSLHLRPALLAGVGRQTMPRSPALLGV